MPANEYQVGGQHYRNQPIQPWDFIAANKLDYFQGAIIKYVCRWRDKDGVRDLQKAAHYLEKYLELAHKEMQADDIPSTALQSFVKGSDA